MNSSVRIALGIVIIILGLLVIITPRYLFPICEYADKEASANASMGANMATGTSTGAMGTMTGQAGNMNGSTTMMTSTGAMTGTDNMQTATTMNMGDTGMDSNSGGMAGMDADEDQGGTSAVTHHMQCYYMGRAALLLGLLTMLIGVGVMIASTAEAARLLALVLGGTGVAIILTPTYFLPICENQQMACHNGAEPMLIVLGAVMLVVAAIIAVLSGKGQAGSS